jgi:hypothetical protein
MINVFKFDDNQRQLTLFGNPSRTGHSFLLIGLPGPGGGVYPLKINGQSCFVLHDDSSYQIIPAPPSELFLPHEMVRADIEGLSAHILFQCRKPFPLTIGLHKLIEEYKKQLEWEHSEEVRSENLAFFD